MSMLTSNAYDPDEPEGPRPASGTYVSRKDIIIIVCVLAVLAILFTPIFKLMEGNAQNSVCVKNLTNIKTAMGLYLTNNDGRYPPAYVEGDNRSPVQFDGMTNNWASVVSPYRSSFGSFTCPTAKRDENSPTQNSEPGQLPIQLSYGFYRARATQPDALVTDPATAILVAETINHGASGSFNPLPFITSDDKEVPLDGFLIGWDDSNFEFKHETSAVTRLAFANVRDGKFGSGEAKTRHDKHINALTTGGNLKHLTPSQSFVERTGNRLTGAWEAR